MAELQFATMQIIEESENSGVRFVTPTKETFSKLEESFNYTKDGSFYNVTVEKHDDYAFFVFTFGNPAPRDENLTNVNTGDKIINQRTMEQAELNNQAFFLFHYEEQLLYVSSSKKKILFESILKEKIQTDFKIKNIYKNEDEFIDVLKECSSISFTHVNNLFNNDSTKKHALVDLTGTDAPDEFTITARYKKNNEIVDFIKGLFQAKRNFEINTLVIKGIDEKGFETVYNSDTFQKKISIHCAKDSNGKFVHDDIRNNLLRKLENEG
ncbi:MAG: hypothetical protein LBI42_11245 [Chitinispirillales bacterium]|jgi:hypothetical protein|nr:hypothetical protein [Chitinispirillales bacterium]